MSNSVGENEDQSDGRILVEASSVAGILDILDLEVVDQDSPDDAHDFSAEFVDIITSIDDIYQGVSEATETDSRGRSRKMVRQFADREDLSSNDVGHILRVLEAHELVVQDGNRWRLAEVDSD